MLCRASDARPRLGGQASIEAWQKINVLLGHKQDMKQYWLSILDPHEAVRGHGLAILKLTPETRKLLRLWRDCFHRLDDLHSGFCKIVVQDDLCTAWYGAVDLDDDLYDEITQKSVLEVPAGSGNPECGTMWIGCGPYAHILKEGVYFTVYVGSDKVETTEILEWDFLLKE